jgi:hypothetical protein
MSHPHLQNIGTIDSHQTDLTGGMAWIGAPVPLLGFLDQSPLRRIAVQVAQFSDPLVLRPNIETVKAWLPDGR